MKILKSWSIFITLLVRLLHVIIEVNLDLYCIFYAVLFLLFCPLLWQWLVRKSSSVFAKLFHRGYKEVYILRGCLHEISLQATWNIFNSWSGLSLVTVYMRYSEMKLIAGVNSLRSFWHKWNFISSDKILYKHYPEMKPLEVKCLRMRIFYLNKDGRKHDYHMFFWENNGENNKRYYKFLRRRCTITKTNYWKVKIRNQVKQIFFASVFLINI